MSVHHLLAGGQHRLVLVREGVSYEGNAIASIPKEIMRGRPRLWGDYMDGAPPMVGTDVPARDMAYVEHHHARWMPRHIQPLFDGALDDGQVHVTHPDLSEDLLAAAADLQIAIGEPRRKAAEGFLMEEDGMARR